MSSEFEWMKAIPRNERGEVGVVYYVNFMVLFNENEAWTKAFPFTLNPERGKTLESMITRSKTVPKQLKAAFFRDKEITYMIMPGKKARVWITRDPYHAPDNWGDKSVSGALRTKQERKLLYL